MSKTAKDVYEMAREKKSEKARDSYVKLRQKCVRAVTEMMSHGEFVTEVGLSELDLPSLRKVTQEMRELGYYYCLIEVQDSVGDILDHRLRISIEHLEE